MAETNRTRTSRNSSENKETTMQKNDTKKTNDDAKTTPRNACQDGCGAVANAGKRFLPGHDAKQASMLQKVADGETKLEDLPQMLQDRLADGRLQLPGPKVRVIETTLEVEFAIDIDKDADEAIEEILQSALRRLKAVRAAQVKQVGNKS